MARARASCSAPLGGRNDTQRQPRLELGSSVKLREEAASIDLVLGSPPYCTRIDYAMATLPELAVMGLNEFDVKQLRRMMIGSATIQDEVTPRAEWGDECISTLDKIRNHQAYASRSYYYKTYTQYFDGMYQTMAELDRVLKQNGECVMVIQDSYYKDVHVDLAKCIQEIAAGFNWVQRSRFDFCANKNIARINPHAVSRGAPLQETVLILSKVP